MDRPPHPVRPSRRDPICFVVSANELERLAGISAQYLLHG
jgi:hypothetical protein